MATEKTDVYTPRGTLVVYALTEWETKTKSGTRFTEIGRAYVNRDGSLNLYLDLLPAKSQTIQIRDTVFERRGERATNQRPDSETDGKEHESPDRPF